MRTLNREAVERMCLLAENSYRPARILILKEEIAGSIRVAELRASISGVVDHTEIERIVSMKLQLDALYADWVEGKFS